MRVLFYGFLVLLAFALGLGEFVVIAGLIVVVARCGWRWMLDKMAYSVVGATALTVLVLHFQGYKLYGSPKLVQVPPLRNARQVVALEPPRTLRFADGTTELLAGVSFPSTVDLHDLFKAHLIFVAERRSEEYVLLVSLTPHGSNSVRGECRHKSEYWCGNTFYPVLFPSRLPSHRIYDLASVMIEVGVAKLDLKADVEKAYADELTKTFGPLQDLTSQSSLGDPDDPNATVPVLAGSSELPATTVKETLP